MNIWPPFVSQKVEIDQKITKLALLNNLDFVKMIRESSPIKRGGYLNFDFAVTNFEAPTHP